MRNPTPLLVVLTVLQVAFAFALACDPLFSSNSGDNENGPPAEDCLSFYAQCFGITVEQAEPYCSFLDQWAGAGECCEKAVDDYFECVIERFDCDTYNPESIRACGYRLEHRLSHCDCIDDDTGWDDDTSDDDDTAPDGGRCADVADGMINTCQTTLTDPNGNPVDESGLEEWCHLSQSMFDPPDTDSPFWTCLGRCVFVEFCDGSCFDACLDPPSPGSGCGGTVDAIYACGIEWLFEGGTYWIPEMDMQAFCKTVPDWPWDCYADCIPGGCNGMLDCLNACDK